MPGWTRTHWPVTPKLWRRRKQEIDELVYALYGLTKDEIKIVEEATLKI